MDNYPETVSQEARLPIFKTMWFRITSSAIWVLPPMRCASGPVRAIHRPLR